MKRKKTNKNEKPGKTARILTQKDDDNYVFIHPCRPEHRRALTRLEKKFGRAIFSLKEAGRIGVGPELIFDLVRFNQVHARSDDRYAINQDASAHAVEFETPIHLFQANYAMFENLPDDSPLRKTMITAERPAPEEDDEISSPFALDPKNVTKRFQMPYWLYLDIRPDIENLSAYIRFLIYTDRGMEKEAQIEKDRMGDSTREK